MTLIAILMSVFSQSFLPGWLGKGAFLYSANSPQVVQGLPLAGQLGAHTGGSDTVYVWADTVAGNIATSVVSNVLVRGLSGVIGFQGTLSWDPAVITFQQVSGFGLPGMSAANFGLGQTGNGVLTYAWNDATLFGQNLADGSAAFSLSFSLSGPSGTSTAIQFENSPTALEISNSAFMTMPVIYGSGLATINGVLRNDVPEAGFGNLVAVSHPFQAGQGSFEVMLPFEGQDITAVSLRNLQGKEIGNPIRWNTSERRLHCELAAGLCPGAMILEIEHAGSLACKRILVNGK